MFIPGDCWRKIKLVKFEFLKEKYNLEISLSTDEMDFLYIEQNDLLNLLFDLKNLPELNFVFLVSLTANDNIKENLFEFFYTLYSPSLNKMIIVKSNCLRAKAQMPSVQTLYRSANFEEREIFDLFGIEFLGHNCQNRLFMPNDWIGYPLRKDYKLQDKRLEWNKR